MESETTNTDTLSTNDLDRALANAIASGPVDNTAVPAAAPSAAPLAEAEADFGKTETDSGQPSVVRWISPSPKRRSNDAIIGIEYSHKQLVLVDVWKSGHEHSLRAFLIAKFESPPDRQTIARMLREFNAPPGCRVQLALTSERAVVRQFTLPPLPKKKRLAAAIWEARKIIPFALREDESVFGFAFASTPEKKWRVTLTAVPGEDEVSLLKAIHDAQWLLEGVSVSGTECRVGTKSKTKAKGAEDIFCGTVLWSPTRAGFAVRHNQELQFHYDLGTIAPPPAVARDADHANEMLKDWLREIGKGIAEAIEFYLGAHPQNGIDRIELFGVPPAAAPLLTDWNERFNAEIAIVDIHDRVKRDFPKKIATWLDNNQNEFAAAILAATGRPAVDMTPAAMVKARHSKLLEHLAKWSVLLSAIAAMTLTGIMWMQKTITGDEAARAEQEWSTLKSSPASTQVQVSATRHQSLQILTGTASRPPLRWMPQIRTILGTLPGEARLLVLTIAPSDVPIRPGEPPLVRLDGKLLPTGRPHSLTLADWIRSLEVMSGYGNVRLRSTREVEWKGNITTIFTLELPLPGIADGGDS